MAAYLISRANVSALDTVVFSAGPKEKEEAIAVFTDAQLATDYIKKAGWQGEYTVATAEPIPFLRWLLQAHDEGVQHLVIDPDYDQHRSGTRLNTMSIEAHLQHAGDHIMAVARPDF